MSSTKREYRTKFFITPSNAQLCKVDKHVYAQVLVCMTLSRLDDLGCIHFKLCAKDPVPEAAGDTETILVVGKVMLKVVLLQLLVVGRKPW